MRRQPPLLQIDPLASRVRLVVRENLTSPWHPCGQLHYFSGWQFHDGSVPNAPKVAKVQYTSYRIGDVSGRIFRTSLLSPAGKGRVARLRRKELLN